MRKGSQKRLENAYSANELPGLLKPSLALSMVWRRLLPLITSAVAVVVDPYAPVPPYPPSPLASRVHVARPSAQPSGPDAGDTWPSTQAADGTLYVAPCDPASYNHHCPPNATPGTCPTGMSFYTLAGTPEAPGSMKLTLQNVAPVHESVCQQPKTATSPQTTNVKVAGLVEVGGTIYLGAQCQVHKDPCI